jgi:L-asparaginase II
MPQHECKVIRAAGWGAINPSAFAFRPKCPGMVTRRKRWTDMITQADILFFTRLAADYAQRADECGSPVLAVGLRRLAAGYLDLAKRLDAEHEADAARRSAA